MPTPRPPSYSAEDVARLVTEPPKATGAPRGPFERDRARVLHSSALRRLAAKTQVVGVGEDDFPRTRLTHSLEVAQVGRELGAALGADPDLCELAGLAHDLGHPPFGHNGEAALDAAAAPCGGFEGNAQSLRELVRLEQKVPGAGLNLTRASLDATCKYPWPRGDGRAKFGVYTDDLHIFRWVRTGAPDGRVCLEAQIMDWADDVAYSVHDLEDGVHAGLVDLGWLDDPGERRAVAAVAVEAYGAGAPGGEGDPGAVRGADPEDDPEADPGAAPGTDPRGDPLAALDRLRREPWWVRGAAASSAGGMVALKAMTSELTARFSMAAVSATRAAYGDGPLRRYVADLVVPPEVRAECAVLKAVTNRWVMGRPGAAQRQAREREVVTALLAAVADRAPDVLEPLLRPAWAAASDDAARLRVVVDQVARLTDLSVRTWHARLCR